jgi:hypothetical protein
LLLLLLLLLLQDEGQSLEEAAEDTVDMFCSSGYDLSRVWIYATPEERAEKEGAVRALEQVQRSARGQDSYLNASFSLGKLRQVCKQHLGPEGTGACLCFQWREGGGS